MTQLIIEDLTISQDLDRLALSRVRGGLNAAVGNAQYGNQGMGGYGAPGGGYGGGFGGYGLVALNMPINAPTTILTEVNPDIDINLGLSNLLGSSQNQLFR